MDGEVVKHWTLDDRPIIGQSHKDIVCLAFCQGRITKC